MNWFYVDAGQQAGPVDDAQLDELARSGKIQPDTLVWREGMSNWQPYREVKPGAGPLRMSGTPAAAAPSLSPAMEEAVCSQCGRIYSKDQIIMYEGAPVCAACKPAFMQKLSEGVAVRVPGQMEYAGFWIRFAAKFVDGLVMLVVMVVPIILLVVSSMRGAGGAPGQAPILMQLGFQALYYVIWGAYSIFFVGKYGATPGKMACKIHIVRADGSKLTYGRATGRFFAEILSGITCYIGYIIAAFDDQKRSLHDHICDTRVVYKR